MNDKSGKKGTNAHAEDKNQTIATHNKNASDAEQLKSAIDDAKHNFHLIEAEMGRLMEQAKSLQINGDKEAAEVIRRRIGVIEQELGKLRDSTAKVPFMLDAFGISSGLPVAELLEPDKIVKATKVERNKTNRIFTKRLGSTVLPSQGPREPVKIVGDNVTDDPKVGKIRLRIGDSTGRLAPNATYKIMVKHDSSKEPRLVKEGRTDSKGYSSTNLGHISLADISELNIILEDDSSPVNHRISKAALLDYTVDGPFIFVPAPKSLIDKLKDRFDGDDGNSKPGTIEDPDETDLQASPESFGLNEEHVDGNCCLRPNGDFAAKEYYFRQVVRLTDIEDAKLVYTREKEVLREDVSAPVDYENDNYSTYAVLGGNVLIGLVNTYRHAWFPAGRGLGRLLYSTSLAPCEEINLAFIDWSRSERDSRTESRSQSEKAEHDLQHDRSIDEVVESTLSEHQDGTSTAGGGGASLDLGIFSIGGGGGSSSSSTNGRRDLHSSTVQGISESVTQHSSSIRHQRATVVTTSYQRESERIETRTIRNHNMNHMMNLEYFQVVEHYSVKTELVEEKPVLLIPYAMDEDLFGAIDSYDKYVLQPSVPVTRFLDRHHRVLSRMVPRRYRRAFQGLSRLLHCRDVYKIETPYATFSRWDIKLSNAWRKGVSLRIQTENGQSVKLYPIGGSSSSPPTSFRSSPIRDSDIKSLTVSFDSSEAMQQINLSPFIESIFSEVLVEATKLKLERVEISATTDRSRFLRTSQTYMVEADGVNVELSMSNPSVEIGLTPPTPDLSSYRGREHKDYCRLKELIAHIQSNPMRYMRAIWLTENSDRRAIRFDRFKLGNQSLLDHIVNKPKAILGNYVAFELLDGHRHVAIESPDYVVSNRVVTLPTRGVFGEVFLSCCNATELRDVERFIDPERACKNNAPDITGVSPGSRAQQSNLAPTEFAAPIVNLQTAPSLPDPTGTANALSVLGTPDIFRDLSRGAELIQFIDNATKEAFTSTRQHRAAMDAIAGDIVKGLVSAYTGVPVGSSGGSSKASQSGTTGITSSPSGSGSTGAKTATGGKSESGQILNDQMVRQTNPTQITDHLQTLQRAVGRGQLSETQGNQIANGLLGGTPLDAGDGDRPIIILSEPTSRDALAFGPSSQNKSGTLNLSATVDNAPDDATTRWTRPNPAAMELTDQSKLSTVLTPLIPGFHSVDFAVSSSNTSVLASIKIPLSVPQFIAIREETSAFEAALATLQLDTSKTAVLQLARQVTDLLLSTANVRTIWEMPPFGETLPTQFAAGGTAAHRVTVATLRGTPPNPGLYGITRAGTGGIGPTVYDEVIDVYPAGFSDTNPHPNLDTLTQQTIAAINGIDFTDLRLAQLTVDIYGRLIGETLAHEIIHSLLGFLIPTGHNATAVQDDIMNIYTDRSFQNRTGIEVIDVANFPDDGTYIDHGIGLINIPTGNTQILLDQHFPISI